MIEIDKSWEFLREFYQSDPSIVKLINKAVAFSADKSLRGDNFENLMVDLLALLPIQVKTYHDFLDYVKPYEDIEDEESSEEADIFVENNTLRVESHENVFLNSNWFENFVDKTFGIIKYSIVAGSVGYKSVLNYVDKFLEKLSGRYYLFVQRISVLPTLIFRFLKQSFKAGKKIRSFPEDVNSSPNLYKPYLILFALGIAEDWFLYDHRSKDFIANENIEKTFRLLRKLRQRKLQGKRKKSINNEKSRNSDLSPEDLYPVMTLLIMLRREWEFSNNTYILLKLSVSSEISLDKKMDSLLYGLYREFEFCDQAIVNDFDPKVSHVKFHPLVAKRIIESESYKIFYKTMAASKLENADWFKYVERYLEKKDTLANKRLLLDYVFPYTVVRDHDVFMPTESETSITDRIYLSLERGKEYDQFWRTPQEDEKFDCIQLLKPLTGSSYDARAIGYQDFLALNGRFLVVKPQSEYELEEKIKSAFSNFRHDLKYVMSGTNISNLQKIMGSIDESNIKINKLIDQVESFIHHTEDVELLRSLKSSIQDLETGSSLRNIPNPGIRELTNTIRKMQSVLDSTDDTTSQESISSLTVQSQKLKLQWAEICIDTVVGQKGRIENIKETHDFLCSYIKIAGDAEPKNKKIFQIVDFLKNYQQCIGLNTGNLTVNINDTAIEPGYTIHYNKDILHIILDSIVDNAIEHGFNGFECSSPTIEFVLVDTDQYLVLKVCNNGRPINITNEGFKTSGVFAGPTGHTGLGGYQISKYAESQGGYVILPKEKEWNTEIHLYIKK